MRTLVFQVSAVLILPLFFRKDGIRFSMVIAEIPAVLVPLLLLKRKQKNIITKIP